MQVPCDEGVAIHIGPESCAVAREGLGEALTGERIGQPLSRESFYSGCRHRANGGRQHIWARQRERPDDPAWSETLACADAPCAGTGRSHDRPFGNSRRSASGRRGAVADDARTPKGARHGRTRGDTFPHLTPIPPCYIAISTRHSPTGGGTGSQPISLPAEAGRVTWPRG